MTPLVRYPPRPSTPETSYVYAFATAAAIAVAVVVCIDCVRIKTVGIILYRAPAVSERRTESSNTCDQRLWCGGAVGWGWQGEAIWCRVSLVCASQRSPVCARRAGGEEKQRRMGLIGFGWIDMIANSTGSPSAHKRGTLSIPTGLNYCAHQRHMSREPYTTTAVLCCCGAFRSPRLCALKHRVLLYVRSVRRATQNGVDIGKKKVENRKKQSK